MEYRSGSPEDDFLYYHREAVCRECLEGAEDAYILEGGRASPGNGGPCIGSRRSLR